MRPLRRTLCVLSFACALPAVAVADEFSEYRIPDHSGGSWFGNLGGNYQGNARAAGAASCPSG